MTGPNMSAHHITYLSEIVGRANCLTTEADKSAYTTDYRKVFAGRAIAVVRPADTRQVSDVMRYCYDSGVAVVPQGGNTSLLGGAVPTEDEAGGQCIILSLTRLNKVVSVDPVNDTMVVYSAEELIGRRVVCGHVDVLIAKLQRAIERACSEVF